jgi:hypothetical protein
VKETDLVQASVVQIGHFVQNSPIVNANGATWKQLADRAEADRQALCKFLDGQALLTGLFHMYAATLKKMKGSPHPSSIESGQEDVLQEEKTNAERETNSEDECCTKNRRGHLQLIKIHGWWQRTFSLRHTGTYLWKILSRAAEETPLKHREQMRIWTKVGQLPSY